MSQIQVDPCTELTCLDGNCAGCKDGQLWCDDPRCEPFCRACEPPENYNSVINVMMLTFIVIVLLLIFVLMYMYGPRFVIMHDGDQSRPYIPNRNGNWGLNDI